MSDNDKKTRWEDQYQRSVVRDIDHSAWRVYNNCRILRSTHELNREYIMHLINGFVTDQLRVIARDLKMLVDV